jgi:hypothetical protein
MLQEFGHKIFFVNGPLEGYVNRLKRVKRSMDGRANFYLLKRRLLYQRKKRQQTKNKAVSGDRRIV